MGQLGAVYAGGLAERGMRVAVLDVTTGDTSDGVRAYACDVTDREAIEESLRNRGGMGVPHLLVNNAALDFP